jgi:hypothetical protein
MAKLKLGPIINGKPVKIALVLPAAALHRDITAYADILSRESEQPITDPVRLIVPMLERFIATDRGFAKARRIKFGGAQPTEAGHSRREGRLRAARPDAAMAYQCCLRPS